jgi:hypothetical protein
MILSALPLGAGTINVSSQVSALFDTGDELSFTVSSASFGINAANFGLPEYPTAVEFTFVSAPEDSPAQFEAVLESGDDSVSVSFGAPLSFIPGSFQGSSYSGAVSVLEGSLHLSETLSQQLFGNSPAVLILLNTGPALTVGLPPYTLQQDMTVSLGGGGLGVGARLGGIALTDSSDPPDPPDAPEPRPGLLLFSGGALLWGLARFVRPSNMTRSADRRPATSPVLLPIAQYGLREASTRAPMSGW